MSIISYPFTTDNITTEQPYGDRAISAEDQRRFFKEIWSNGVRMSSNDGSELQVIAGDGMNVIVSIGGCHIEGAWMDLDEARTMAISASSSTMKRIDRIVARFDSSQEYRSIEIYKKEGTFSATPEAPALIQQPNYYEIALADVTVKAGVTEITNAVILDRRLDSSLCGMVVPAFPTPLNLSKIADQYQTLLASAIDATTAGHLENEISNLDTKTATTIITKTNVSVAASDAVADATFADYPYRVDIPVTGCTTDYRPEIDLEPNDASSIFYDLCKTDTDKVSVWLANNTFGTITILTLQLTKQRGA